MNGEKDRSRKRKRRECSDSKQRRLDGEGGLDWINDSRKMRLEVQVDCLALLPVAIILPFLSGLMRSWEIYSYVLCVLLGLKASPTLMAFQFAHFLIHFSMFLISSLCHA